MPRKCVKDTARRRSTCATVRKMTEAAPPDGTAVVLCDGAFGSTEGKTAHGLVRHTGRYRVLAIIDRDLQGRDAGEVLDGVRTGIPIVADLDGAIRETKATPDILVVGVATHGGVLPPRLRPTIAQ